MSFFCSLSNDQHVLFSPDQTFQQMSEQLKRTHQDKLHQSRKLVLMVDLDNTLIHTTEMPCQCSPKKVLCVCVCVRSENAAVGVDVLI